MPVAVGLYDVIIAEEAGEHALGSRVVEYLVEFGHGVGDGVAGVGFEGVELLGNGFICAVG